MATHEDAAMERLEAAFLAARRGDSQAVLNLIASDTALLTARDAANASSLLHIASRLSAAPLVAHLLLLRADTEARDRGFRTPLHLAARADAAAERLPLPQPAAPSAGRDGSRLAAVKALLSARARVTARDGFGFTALHHAAAAGHTDVVELLLSLPTAMGMPRAPLESETNAEERPLHLAAMGGHVETVRRLLERGSHPEKANYVGHTALHLAVQGGDAPAMLRTVQEMIKREWRANLNAAAADGSTPLHLAAAGGHGRMVSVLLSAPNIKRHGNARTVDLRAVDKRGRTAAEVAAAGGFDDVVKLIEDEVMKRERRDAAAPAEQHAALLTAMKQMRVERPSQHENAMHSVEEENCDVDDDSDAAELLE
ncbi:hypothetical protein AB1Y20_019241 [Prymnesium parvum]|uniref:Uncharacterized protein n=1 Tax=Prymnesium parvum TaxID=97485 RepID=A0AB34JQM9_PRYPA